MTEAIVVRVISKYRFFARNKPYIPQEGDTEMP